MPWTQADVDTLKAAIAAGAAVKRIKFADSEYEFRDLAEMRTQLALMQQEVNAAGGTPKNYRVATTGKGL